VGADFEHVEKVVVVVDIRSSTKILKNLNGQRRVEVYLDFIYKIKEWLRLEMPQYGLTNFEAYKFLGDGWILILDAPNGIKEKEQFKAFMVNLCISYESIYNRTVKKTLNIDIGKVGLSIGIDEGILFKNRMIGKKEYVGVPINVAARLQDKSKSVKEASKIEFPLLISNNAWNRCFRRNAFEVIDLTVELRNYETEFSAKLIDLGPDIS
jgi:hypothetical protein